MSLADLKDKADSPHPPGSVGSLLVVLRDVVAPTYPGATSSLAVLAQVSCISNIELALPIQLPVVSGCVWLKGIARVDLVRGIQAMNTIHGVENSP